MLGVLLANATGHLVRAGQWQTNATEMSIETTTLPSGLYFYVFRPNQGEMLVQKLVIHR